jgi:DNA-binding transcriptional ArsR family regulator
VLREAELILAEREGQFIRYELNTTVFQDLIQHLLGLTNGERPDA